MTDAALALKAAIDDDDLGRVRSLMSGDPTLHDAPIGYAGDGALTWARRVPRATPGTRETAAWRSWSG